jgi:protein gp37
VRRKRPRRIFVNSMSDLFHPNVPDEWIDRVFAVMALCPQHTFQVLTKRPDRMRAYCDTRTDNREESIGTHALFMSGGKHNGFLELPVPNVQLGVSVEDQKTADERIPLLLQTPAAVRFISAEPLLGSVFLREEWLEQEIYDDDAVVPVWLDWVICGGESGPGARPMHPAWARGLRYQCVAAGVPFFFKQWGGWAEVERRLDLPAKPWMVQRGDVLLNIDGSVDEYDDCGGIGGAVPMRRVGKKAAGSLLDGKEWKEFPR